MVRATLSSRNELQPTMAPPGFCNRGEVRYGSIGGLEYEAPQKLTHYTVHREFVGFGICRVIRRSSMTMKAHTYYIIFGRTPIGGKLSPFPPWRRHWQPRLFNILSFTRAVKVARKQDQHNSQFSDPSLRYSHLTTTCISAHPPTYLPVVLF